MVQESRFRIVCDDGRAFLLTLANDAPLGAQQLLEFAKAAALVRVHYTGEPNQVSGAARRIQTLDGPNIGRRHVQDEAQRR
jgi:hypothetical protein